MAGVERVWRRWRGKVGGVGTGWLTHFLLNLKKVDIRGTFCLSKSSWTSDSTCETCHSGYWLEGDKCKPYTCPLDKCKSCVEQKLRTSDWHCAPGPEGCFPGYRIQPKTTRCKPYPCVNGTNGTSCATCTQIPTRTADDQCASCHPGYELKDHHCPAYACVQTKPAACKACVEQTKRTSQNDCASCWPGYHLVALDCVAYKCLRTAATHCATCVDQEERKTDADCETCEPGYYLVGTKCHAYQCEKTKAGEGCRDCVVQGKLYQIFIY